MNGVALGRCQINIRPRGYWILEGYVIIVTGTQLLIHSPGHFIVLKTIEPIKNLSMETKLNYFYFTLQRLPDFEDASQFFTNYSIIRLLFTSPHFVFIISN